MTPLEERHRSRVARRLLRELMSGPAMRTPPVLMMDAVRVEDVVRRLGAPLRAGDAGGDVRAVFAEFGVRSLGELPTVGGELFALVGDDMPVPMALREAAYLADLAALTREEVSRWWGRLGLSEEGAREAGEGSLELALARIVAGESNTEESGSMDKTLERIADALERIAKAAEHATAPAGKPTETKTTADAKVKPEAKPDAKPEAKPDAKPEAKPGKAKKHTKEDVIARLRQLIDKDGRDAAFEVLADKGGKAKSASELKEEHYEAVMAELDARLGAAGEDPTN